MLTKALFTGEDLERIQALTGKNYELIRGELFEASPVTFRHGQVAAQIGRLLLNWNDGARFGQVSIEAGYRIGRDPDTVRGPDVSFVPHGRLSPEQRRRGFPDATPDLAVEVRSPNDTWKELTDKADQFLEAGTPLVWIVEPDESVEVRRAGLEPVTLGPEDALSAEDVLPGFRCRVRDLFPA
ncbi:MAG: Uma2 family endonuclease [Chloroflexota bacterium]